MGMGMFLTGFCDINPSMCLHTCIILVSAHHSVIVHHRKWNKALKMVSPCLTHSLCGQHVFDGMVVLLGQDGQFTCLLLFESLQYGFMLWFGRGLQQVVAQGFVLSCLNLTGVLELTFDLELFRLKEQSAGNILEHLTFNQTNVFYSSGVYLHHWNVWLGVI